MDSYGEALTNAIVHCDGITGLTGSGEKSYQLTAAELAGLLNRTIALEAIAARFGVKIPKIGANIKRESKKKY
jgi:hypothetical protein